MPPVLVSGGKLSARLMADGTGGAGFQRLLLIFQPFFRLIGYVPLGRVVVECLRRSGHILIGPTVRGRCDNMKLSDYRLCRYI